MLSEYFILRVDRGKDGGEKLEGDTHSPGSISCKILRKGIRELDRILLGRKKGRGGLDCMFLTRNCGNDKSPLGLKGDLAPTPQMKPSTSVTDFSLGLSQPALFLIEKKG